IGAYRDNEVDATHPLILTLEQIQKAGIQVDNIVLQPLGVESIAQLIADSFYCSTEDSKSLAELVKNKTDGNPFFLTQLLQSLYTEKLVSLNHNTGRWLWNIEQIQAIGITKNVVELMVSKIEKLNPKTQQIIKLAACIGNRFDLEVLSFVNAKSPAITASELWPALQEELIVPLDDGYKVPMLLDGETRAIDSSQSVNYLNHPSSILYKFLHDRVQQAAYLLIPDERKQAVHLQIGQLLLKNIKPDELEEYLFDIVNQLNIGAELITERSQRNDLAKLNLQAGKKAKASTAYQPALRYLKTGLKLLASDSWNREYKLTFDLHLETIEAQYVNTQFEQAD
ncbi:MAG: ATP-binding protein, partial [Microcystaceae cyanobacterium]